VARISVRNQPLRLEIVEEHDVHRRHHLVIDIVVEANPGHPHLPVEGLRYNSTTTNQQPVKESDRPLNRTSQYRRHRQLMTRKIFYQTAVPIDGPVETLFHLRPKVIIKVETHHEMIKWIHHILPEGGVEEVVEEKTRCFLWW
jgi:hypothetical protein